MRPALLALFTARLYLEIQVPTRSSTQEEHLMTRSDVPTPASPFSTLEKTQRMSNVFLIQYTNAFQLFQFQNKGPDFFLFLSCDQHLQTIPVKALTQPGIQPALWPRSAHAIDICIGVMIALNLTKFIPEIFARRISCQGKYWEHTTKS